MRKPKYFEALTMGDADKKCEHDSLGPGVYVIAREGGSSFVLVKDQVGDANKFHAILAKQNQVLLKALPNCSKCGQPHGLV